MEFLRSLLSRQHKKQYVEEAGVLQRDIQTQVISTPQIDLPAGLTISVAQDIGTRDYQEDYCAYSAKRDEFAAIVCDGMGGLQGSAQAAQTAAKAWISLYEKGILDFPAFAEEAAVEMDRSVQGCKNAGGTTAAAIWIKGNQLHWMSVGDSKIYIARRGALASATREHNYQLILETRLKRHKITQTEYDRELAKGASLVSYIGKGQMPLIDISHEALRLRDGDTVLVCSDGLYKALPESKIKRVLASYYGDFETVASYLLDLSARCAKKRDNITIVAVRYHDKTVAFLE